MSDWTSKHAIMRDLAEAQGFDVPADLEGIGANEKPPALNIPEDTGEDYFGHGEGEGDCGGPPDLALIQHMLDMVRDVGISNCEDTPEQVLQISKPITLNIGKDITNNKTGTIPKTVQKHEKPQVKKVKKKRENCAVNSILLAMAEDTPILDMESQKEPLKLLKPTDFMSSSDTDIVQSVEKVNGWLNTQVPIKTVDKINGWLDSQEPSVSKFTDNPLILEPSSMFKRKSSSTVKSPQSASTHSSSPLKQAPPTIASYKPSIAPADVQEPNMSRVILEPGSMFKRRSGSTAKSLESDSVKSPPPLVPSVIESYKPSMLASAYYQKYVERNKVKEYFEEDVWTRAERIMKEIDAKKKIEAENAAKETALIESTTDVIDIDIATIDETVIDIPAIDAKEVKIPDTLEFLQNEQRSLSQNSPISSRDLVELPQHRHLLTGECIVCKVVKAHGYDVDAEIYGNLK